MAGVTAAAAPRPFPLRSHGYWTRERIIDALRAWSAAHGGDTPRMLDWIAATPATPAHRTVCDRFGTWNAAVVAAGLTPRKAGRPAKPRHGYWTRARVIDALRTWSNVHNGDTPRMLDWRPGTAATPCDRTVRDMFGGWNAAIVAAGLTPRNPYRPRKAAA